MFDTTVSVEPYNTSSLVDPIIGSIYPGNYTSPGRPKEKGYNSRDIKNECLGSRPPRGSVAEGATLTFSPGGRVDSVLPKPLKV